MRTLLLARSENEPAESEGTLLLMSFGDLKSGTIFRVNSDTSHDDVGVSECNNPHVAMNTFMLAFAFFFIFQRMSAMMCFQSAAKTVLP